MPSAISRPKEPVETDSISIWLLSPSFITEPLPKARSICAIAGGGRYDNLVKLISGGKVSLPALGFGMGDVVLFELLKARGLLPQFNAGVDVFVMIEDENLRPQSLKLVQDLRAAGKVVEYALTPTKPDKQFKRAQELNAKHTMKVDGEAVRVRNFQTREEKVFSVDEAVKLQSGI